MPNIKSAKKRVLTNKRKENENILVESRMKNSIKKLEKSIKAQNHSDAKSELTTTLKNIDKAQNINIIKKNKASRLKSRLTTSVNKLENGNI